MRALRIARLDGRRLARSPGTWIAAALFAVLVLAGVSLPALVLEDPAPDVGAAFLLGPAVDLVLPAIAIVLTYAAVAGLQADGRIKVLLGAPVDRRDVLIGVTMARIGTAWTVALAGSLAGVVGIIVLYGVPPIGPVIAFVLVTLIATASFVAVGIGVSALVGSPTRAVAALIGGFVVARSLWEPLWRGVHYLVVGEPPGPAPSRWYEAAVLASPLEAYTTAADGLLPPSPHLEIAIGEGGARADPGAMVGGEIAAPTLAIALASLVLWGLVCLLAGGRALESAEID